MHRSWPGAAGLWSTLVLLLVKHPSRQRQHASKDNLTEQVGAAFDLAGNIADDADEIGPFYT
jgi:hypothetical protein